MVASEPGPIVVCDAGPLIHLDELGCLGLLNLFSEILVPEAVWAEVHQHRPSALRHRRVRLNKVDIVADPAPVLAALMGAFPLDPGEKQALRLMQQFPDATLLSDDGQARLVAKGMGYRVHGTVGVLLLALQHGRSSKRRVINLLRAIPRKSSLHMQKRFLDSVIRGVQEKHGQ